MPYKEIDGLSIAGDLYDILGFEILAGTGVGAHQFWTGFARLIADLMPRQRELLRERTRLQDEIDDYFRKSAGQPFDAAAYEAHLKAIGYLCEPPEPFQISTANVDDLVARAVAPQFVVPGSSPRFLTRAVNARWSSLYDALYGSDLIPDQGDAKRGQGYNKARGALVIERGRAFLDAVVPLSSGSHRSVRQYWVASGVFTATMENGDQTGLKEPAQFAAYQGASKQPSSLLLSEKGLFVELKIDARNPVGKEDTAHIADIILETALTTIVDFEDTIVAVDATDKIELYRNWIAIVKGALRTQFKKNGRLTDRLPSPDYRYIAPQGGSIMLSGRGLVMARVPGLHRTTDLVRDADGNPISEMILDIALAAVAGLHDTRRTKPPRNSDAGAIYIIVPKLQGPEEAAFVNEVFLRIEDILSINDNALKLGLEAEECRTSLNLANAIKPFAERLAWIGTAPYERARDQVATAMEAGPVVAQRDLMALPWMKAYAQATIETALACGCAGLAQIAMGPAPSSGNAADLVAQQTALLQAGATAVYAASPSAATLIAMAVHLTDSAQPEVRADAGSLRQGIADQLAPPVDASLSAETLRADIEAACESVLELLVECIERGSGALRLGSGADIRTEDRAALRLATTLFANWLRHGLVTRDDLAGALRTAAARIDKRYKDDPAYRPMAPDFDGSVFNAAADMIFSGRDDREADAILIARRRETKAGQISQTNNRFEFLRGATGRLESGEHFRAND